MYVNAEFNIKFLLHINHSFTPSYNVYTRVYEALKKDTSSVYEAIYNFLYNVNFRKANEMFICM